MLFRVGEILECLRYFVETNMASHELRSVDATFGQVVQ